MLSNKADFFCIGNNNNKTIINKNKIVSINIREVDDD